jgi:hypothetical protein
MKKRYTFFFLLGLMSLTLNAQVTCDEPGVLLMDDLSAYAAGDITFQSDDWDTWPGATAGAEVSTEQANTGSNSIKIDGNIDGQDALLLLGGQESGHYVLSWSMFVYDSTSAYFNLQHEAPTATEGFWAFDVSFEDGKGTLEKYDGSDDASFAYPSGTWFPVYLFIDIDSDYARLVVNERTVDTWPFSSGNTVSSQMHSINFYPQSTGHSYYIDDISLLEIPAAEAGQYCYTAEALEEPGFYAVPDLVCYGGSYDQGGNGSGFRAYWYTYTPATDGILSVSSCGGGVDTRLWIFKGADCENLGIVGVNDDRCDTGNDNDYASYREAVVTAGETYYIMFDDAWETDGFGFELALVEEAPAVGQFCESAEDIEPGEHEVGAIDGESAVAGPNINNTSGSTTNYAQSKWYQFTPDGDGYMSISACDFAASDTHFFVYTGDCSTFEGLNLVAQNDNGCGEGLLTSSLDSIEVTAGVTYYIEWIDRWMDGPSDELYIWELGFDAFVGVEQDEALQQSFTVFPNPASEVLNVRLEQGQFKERTQVTLMNLLGQPLAERQLDGGEAQLQLPVHNLPAGTYQLRVIMGGRQATQKVLIK